MSKFRGASLQLGLLAGFHGNRLTRADLNRLSCNQGKTEPGARPRRRGTRGPPGNLRGKSTCYSPRPSLVTPPSVSP